MVPLLMSILPSLANNFDLFVKLEIDKRHLFECSPRLYLSVNISGKYHPPNPDYRASLYSTMSNVHL